MLSIRNSRGVSKIEHPLADNIEQYMLLHMHHVELAKMLQLPCKSSYLYRPPHTQTHTLGQHPTTTTTATPCLSITRTPFISFIQPLSLRDGLSSRPVGVERPICGLILLRWRAVNTHFCGCQFGEGGLPCGTERSTSGVPSSGNTVGWKAARATLTSPHTENNGFAF